MTGVTDRVVLLAGATSDAGLAAARALLDAGARVIATGRDRAKLDALADSVPGISTDLVDLTDEAAVDELAPRVRTSIGPIDGLLHLVGGFRRGDGIPGQSDADWDALVSSLTALRHVSRAFYPDLVASPAGRLAIVSSTSATKPHRNTANYSTVKAAAEAWTAAVASGFSADAPEKAAAVTFAVSSLAGVEGTLASRFVGLWDEDANALNGSRHLLSA
jgi:NADP-dependent 3-hydroxy acid dehydrogenase YdfG